MSDRPSNVVDHDNDQPNNHNKDLLGLSLEDAADQLGITVNAVRQRIKRGTINAERTNDGWVVFLSTDQPTKVGRSTGTANRPSVEPHSVAGQPTDQASIEPLVELISDLTRQNAELSAAAALWQERARFLGERLNALEAGAIPQSESAGVRAPNSVNTPVERTEGSGRVSSYEMTSRTLLDSHEAPVPTEVTLATGWRRWWRRVLGHEG